MELSSGGTVSYSVVGWLHGTFSITEEGRDLFSLEMTHIPNMDLPSLFIMVCQHKHPRTHRMPYLPSQYSITLLLIMELISKEVPL